MAHVNPSNGLQGARPRPGTRPIVPAIPLPYIHKRNQQLAAAASRRAEQKIVAPAPASPSPAVVELSPILGKESTGAEVPLDIAGPATPSTLASQSIEAAEAAAPSGLPENLIQDQLDREDQPEALPAPSSDTSRTISQSTVDIITSPVPQLENDDRGAPAIEGTISSPKQRLPGARYPGHHHAHPSTGSLVFGGYADSNNSSPAPPSGPGMAAFQPHHPPRLQRGQSATFNVNTGANHMHNYSAEFNQLGQPGPAAFYPRQEHNVSSNGADFARRQMVSFPPRDGFSPHPLPFNGDPRLISHEPATPHSYHGSQSSIPNDIEGNAHNVYNALPKGVGSNGSNGNIEDLHQYQPRPKYRPNSHQVATPQNNYPQQPQLALPPVLDNLDGLVGYILSQFGESQFADYTLELRYADDRAAPVRIPGHNLLFARSPALKKLMVTQANGSNSDGLTLRTLLIESNDRFISSDGFCLATQRLYGGRLLDIGMTAASIASAVSPPPTATPGTPMERFDLAIGYAASGHLLQVPPVVGRGIEVASQFMNWATVEKALDFGLDGGLDLSQWSQENSHHGPPASTYGPAVNMLIHSALNFIINSFPPHFELDTSVSEPAHNARLPFVRGHRPSPPKNRLSAIKFGDHPSESMLQSSADPILIILSRILINLPFQLLKYVLESNRLGNVQDWASTSLRLKVMQAVIEERELRRIEARNFVSVTNAERVAKRNLWEVVGWQESIIQSYSGSEQPTLLKTWVEFVIPDVPQDD